MTAKRILILAGAIVLALLVAYLAAYLPARQQRTALEGQVASLQQRLAESDARVRGGRLLGELLHVSEAVVAMNYGEAQTRSSRFFDEVSAESGRTTDSAMRSVLQALAQNRDVVTSALARADASVIDTLRKMEIQLRAALGYPTPRPG